jgi:hypothetical protein
MSRPGAKFNLTAFKRDWRTLCALGNIDPAEGVQQQSSYELCNLRAEWHKKEAAQRTFESRCSTPDRGEDYHPISNIVRPFEAEPIPLETWEGLGFITLMELWREVKEEEAQIERIERAINAERPLKEFDEEAEKRLLALKRGAKESSPVEQGVLTPV